MSKTVFEHKHICQQAIDALSIISMHLQVPQVHGITILDEGVATEDTQTADSDSDADSDSGADSDADSELGSGDEHLPHAASTKAHANGLAPGRTPDDNLQLPESQGGPDAELQQFQNQQERR